LEAWASPNNLGICPAVGDISEQIFFVGSSFSSFHLHLNYMVASGPICLPADMSFLYYIVYAINQQKLLHCQLSIAIIKFGRGSNQIEVTILEGFCHG
jgi:hypothetical protein